MAEKAASARKKSQPERAAGMGSRIRAAGVARVVAIVVCLGLLAATLGAGIFYGVTKLPDPNADFQTETTLIYYNDGETPLGTLAVQNRRSIPSSEMPQDLKDAVVAAEDRTFWTNKGISPSGMLRAALAIARGGDVQGGSTITQQYIKILYHSSDRTMSRKFRELVLAVKMGREVPKDDILQGYLNTIYFGRGAYGAQAAATTYFDADAQNLDLSQSAFLASVLNSPALYDPSNADNLPRLTERYQYVLDGMLEAGTITAEEHATASAALPEFPEIRVSETYRGPQGYLMRMVEDELLAKGFTQEQVSGGGLTVTTTFDKAMQDQLVKSAQKYEAQGEASAKTYAARVKDYTYTPGQLHAAAASVEVGTGAILAAYGGPDNVDSPQNWATTARHAGSSFKPYALVAGLRNGQGLATMLRGDTFKPVGEGVPVRNAGNASYGTVSLLKATTSSINTAYVDLVMKIKDGPDEVIKAANDLGIPTGTDWDANNRIALGMPHVSPVKAASAYATFANNGARVEEHVVSEVTDSSGAVLYTASDEATQVLEKDIARDVNYALKSVVQSGTGTGASALGRDVAAKTGTAAGNEIVNGQYPGLAAWVVGYTKQVSTAVMFVAGPEGTSDLNPYAGGGRASFAGSAFPLSVWLDYMKVASKGMPKETFDPPAYVNKGRPVTTSQNNQGNRRNTRTTDAQSDQSNSDANGSNPDTGQTAGPGQTQTAPPDPTQAPNEAPTAAADNSPTRPGRGNQG